MSKTTIWSDVAWLAMTLAALCAVAAKGDWSNWPGRITNAGLILAALGAACKDAPKIGQ